MKKYKEIRTINLAKLHNLCVENGWYTMGDKEEYWSLYFDIVKSKDNLTTADIIEIAIDILHHSEFEEPCTLEDIASEIAGIAHTTFVKA